MDIKAKVTEVVDKVKNDPDFKKKFDEDPVKAVESVIGIDLPDDMVNGLISGVKDKLAGGSSDEKKDDENKDDDKKDGDGGIVDKIKSLF